MDFGANKTPAEVITLSAKISCYLCSYIFLGEEGSSEIHFLGGNVEVDPCCEMYFLRKQLFQFLDSWLLISVVVLLYTFIAA